MNFPFRPLFLVVSLLFLSQHVAAQAFKQKFPNPIPPGGNVSLFDYDTDGDPDLVTMNIDATLMVFQNDNGKFTDTHQDLGKAWGAIRWADWEGDGDKDMFVVGDQCYIFTYDAGKFTLHSSFYAKQFQWIDFDNDGKEDLIVSQPDDIRFVRFTGLGYFESQNVLPLLPNVSVFNAADYDKDGDVDLLILRPEPYNNVAGLYWNDQGNFTKDTTTFSTNPFYVNSLDYDGDNDIDIIFKLSASADIEIFSNTGGQFKKVTDPFLNKAFIPIDLDNDKDLDLIYGATADSAFTYENKGNGVYEKIHRPEINAFKDYYDVSYAPEGNDPNGWLAISGRQVRTGNNITTVLHKIDGKYIDVYPNPFDQVTYSPLVEWIDYDKNGTLDLFVNGTNRDKASSVLYKQAADTFSTAYLFPDEKYLTATGPGQWLDFDNNGTIDYVTLVGRNVVLYSGFTEGKIESTLLISQPNLALSFVMVVDINHDGKNDLIIDNSVWVNQGNGQFASSNLLDVGYAPYGLGKPTFADVSGDGNLDVAMYVGGDFTANLYLFTYAGGSYTKKTIATLPVYWNVQINCLDFDKDGDLDVFLFGRDTYSSIIKSRLYRNDNGIFSQVDTGDVFSSMDGGYNFTTQVVDFNGDGYPDMSMATPEGFYLFINYQGTFEKFLDHGIPKLENAAYDWGDFDNDNDLDLAISGLGANGGFMNIFVNQFDASHYQHIDFNPPASVSILNDPLVLSASSTWGLPVSFSMPASSVASLNGNTVTLLSAGTFQVTASQQGNGNVQPAASVTRQITVVKATQTITFPAVTSRVVGDLPFELDATASSGLTVEYTSSETSVASLVGNTVTLVGAGSTTFTATQQGNNYYLPAEPVSVVLNVESPKTITAIESLNESVIVYPNPATKKITISLAGLDPNTPTKIYLFDMKGQLIQSNEAYGQEFSTEITALPSGLYIFELSQGSKRVSKRFVKI